MSGVNLSFLYIRSYQWKSVARNPRVVLCLTVRSEHIVKSSHSSTWMRPGLSWCFSLSATKEMLLMQAVLWILVGTRWYTWFTAAAYESLWQSSFRMPPRGKRKLQIYKLMYTIQAKHMCMPEDLRSRMSRMAEQKDAELLKHNILIPRSGFPSAYRHL